MSLHEIKDFLDRRTPESFLTLLREQQIALERERRRLEAVELLLQENIKTTEVALNVELGTVRIEQLPEEYYVTVDAPDFKHYDEQQFLLQTRSFIDWARDDGILDFRPGDIVTKESLESGGFVEDYYYYYVDPNTYPGKTQVKPAGTYAVLYHMGSYETSETAYKSLVNWIKAHGYQIMGPLFEEDLIHFMATSDPNRYVMKICIQVEQA